LADKLRSEVARSGLTNFEIAKRIDVQPSTVGRFLRREQDLRLGAADRLMRELGFEVVTPEDKRKGRRRASDESGSE
jgi:plasmid maintenance system antidote protein VapI